LVAHFLLLVAAGVATCSGVGEICKDVLKERRFEINVAVEIEHWVPVRGAPVFIFVVIFVFTRVIDR